MSLDRNRAPVDHGTWHIFETYDQQLSDFSLFSKVYFSKVYFSKLYFPKHLLLFQGVAMNNGIQSFEIEIWIFQVSTIPTHPGIFKYLPKYMRPIVEELLVTLLAHHHPGSPRRALIICSVSQKSLFPSKFADWCNNEREGPRSKSTDLKKRRRKRSLNAPRKLCKFPEDLNRRPLGCQAKHSNHCCPKSKYFEIFS